MDAPWHHALIGPACVGLVALLAAPAHAADEPDPPASPSQPVPMTQPARDPALSNPGVDRTMLEQSRNRLNTEPIDPVPLPRAQRPVPSVPPPAPLMGDGSAAAPRPATVTAEGAVTGAMRGRLYRAGGELIFAAMMRNPDAAADQAPPDERAFVLLPNQTLAQLSGATANMGDGVPISLSGQAFSYRGTAYLLPLAFSITQEAPAAPATTVPNAPGGVSTAPEAAVPGTGPGTGPAADPRVADLVARLEQNRQPRALDPAMMATPPDAPTTPVSPQAGTRPQPGPEFTPSLLGALAPEGTLVVRARGRLLRPGWASGRLVVTFDNDPSSPSRAPMLMMPSRMLEQAEAMAGQLGEDATFLVSGRVTIHEGRNYFLPIMVQRLPRGDVRPGQ